MRPTLRPDNLVEWAALLANRAPVPAVEAMFGMGTGRVVMAGQRLGVYEELAKGPATAEELAVRRQLDPAAAYQLLRCLQALGHVDVRGDLYRLSRCASRWLDPGSPTCIGGFLEFNYDQWEWWTHLEDRVRTGRPFDIHAADPDDPYWRRYIVAMFELARLVAPEVARKLRLPARPQRLLDLGGGHGWFSAELCRRHPSLQATVLDLPGSARIGREIIASSEMSERVKHTEGNFLTDELEGPYDGALLFQIVHHLSAQQNQILLQRIRAALKPGGVLAVLDYFESPACKRPDASAFLGLHFCLTSGASTYTAADLSRWLRSAGFSHVRLVRLRHLPIQSLYEAHN